MSRIEIGIGAIVAAVASLGGAGSTIFNLVLMFLGFVLLIHGGYEVYAKPNLWLDKALKRWLERHYWTVTGAQLPKDKFYFGVWAEDESNRKVFISREKGVKGILAFTAPIDLDTPTLGAISTKLSAIEQQRLYEDLHVLLASMHLGYNTGIFTNMSVQHALPIDEHLSEHSVDMKAKEVVDGVAAARSLVRKAVL